MLNILQLSTIDIGGGAERVAWNLHQSYQILGYSSWLAVGSKRSEDQSVIEIPRDGNCFFDNFFSLANRVSGSLGRLFGVEDFNFPGSRRILKLISSEPDIVHTHNLHGNYFDLRYLASLSHQVPLFITLHDAWMLAGHCAHSFECERWIDGCGQCPHLDTYPSIRRDASNYNWQRKRNIYSCSRLNIATPCKWLMDKVEQSILAPSIISKRVIPNGVDMTIFRPGEKAVVRKELNIPLDATVLLFAANGIRQNPWKDYITMRETIERIDRQYNSSMIWFLAVGEQGPDEYIGSTRIRFVPFVHDVGLLAKYYQAADIYIHAARADTFPNTILEGLACGIPVVATRTGGIPEQIDDGNTGFLVPPGDAAAMADRCITLLKNRELSIRIGESANVHAFRHFSLTKQAENYLEWYHDNSHR